MKAQPIRLIDVFVLGPFMIYLAARKGTMTQEQRALLAIGGIATILYNGANYLTVKETNDAAA